jgi:hypothetical protein
LTINSATVGAGALSRSGLLCSLPFDPGQDVLIEVASEMLLAAQRATAIAPTLGRSGEDQPLI